MNLTRSFSDNPNGRSRECDDRDDLIHIHKVYLPGFVSTVGFWCPETVVEIVALKSNAHSPLATVMQKPASLGGNPCHSTRGKNTILATKVVSTGTGF